VPKTIYFVAGEASGDNHGAALMRSLREEVPGLTLIGRGGPRMTSQTDAGFHDWIDHAAVVGLWEVIKKYGYFRKQFHETLREIEMRRPDAVVLIDYPGFNLRLARALRRKEHRPRIIYYISPQVWAWNRGRIKQMARWLDLMLCIFPFEAELYNESGLRTVFVGHPMSERLEPLRLHETRDPQLVALFPGSRRREVRKILPILLATARELVRSRPGLHFEIAAASPELAREIREEVEGHPNEQELFAVRSGSTAASMQRAAVGMVASGSATLEAAYFGLPFVLVYKVAWLTYLVGRMVVQVDYLGMPNVLAGRVVVPEFIQHKARPKPLGDALLRLLNDAAARAEMTASFEAIISSLGQGGASSRAARAIAEELETKSGL
jgi:lipid-A-disaccharide synthase